MHLRTNKESIADGRVDEKTLSASTQHGMSSVKLCVGSCLNGIPIWWQCFAAWGTV